MTCAAVARLKGTHMHAMSWMIPSWSAVTLQEPGPSTRWPCFRHASSDIVVIGTATLATQGQSVWMADAEGQQLGIAWDWAEVRPGVPALSDPNAILSNLRFVDAAGDELEEAGQLRSLNELVYGLAWQEPVRHALRLLAHTGASAPRQRKPVPVSSLMQRVAPLPPLPVERGRPTHTPVR